MTNALRRRLQPGQGLGVRRSRLKAAPDSGAPAYYHCLSRVVDRQFLFQDAERERFAKLLRECERFCRVRVLTYCILSNHFHVLVEVPVRPEPAARPGPEEVVRDLRRLSGHQFPGAVAQRFATLREAGDDQAVAAYLATFHARMWDVSAFMKLLKQRFTQWYNVRRGRQGTLWEERFRSVMVEGAGEALATMAAYIDLNPVRAGMVDDPGRYRWCGYAEAVAGQREARSGIGVLAAALGRGERVSGRAALAIYRRWLHLEGDERREGTRADGRPARGAIRAEAVAEVLRAKGRLPVSDYLRCRVRYFCDGAVLGGRAWVEGVFAAQRHRFGPRRPTGARKMRGLDGLALFTVRDLRKEVFGSRRELVPEGRPREARG